MRELQSYFRNVLSCCLYPDPETALDLFCKLLFLKISGYIPFRIHSHAQLGFIFIHSLLRDNAFLSIAFALLEYFIYLL